MSTEDLSKRTTFNIQEKANLIWAIADKLVGTYKPHEYGNVILPMCVIKRFSDTLAPSKQKVIDTNAMLDKRGLAVTDESGQPILKKGKPQADSAKRDTESIPWKENIDDYMAKNVLPYAPDAWIDEKKTRVGYEIPFTREFYKYVAPRRSDEIFASLQDLDRQEQELMAKIIGR